MNFNAPQSAKAVSIVPSFVSNTQNAAVLAHGPSIVNVGAPNRTIYVQNINERASCAMLRYDLQRIFEDYGCIQQIVAKRNLRLRGQAFIVFDSVDAAKRALESQQGRPLYGKPMVIRFAKFKSDIVSRADGTFDDEHRRIDADRLQRLQTAPKSAALRGLLQTTPNGATIACSAAGSRQTAATSAVSAIASIPAVNAPHKTLFVQNVPANAANGAHFVALWARFAGFVEVRTVPGRADLAFVDYETEAQAAAAKSAVERQPVNLQVGDGAAETLLSVAFAKK